MHSLTITFVLSQLIITIASAAPVSNINAPIKIGKRNLFLPDSCKLTISPGNEVDILGPLRKAFSEINEVALGAIVFNPESFNKWFTQYLPLSDHETFRAIVGATSFFDLPQKDFETIFFDCQTLPTACSTLKEPDGAPRLAVSDPENNVIYACPALFKLNPDGSSPLRLVFSVKKPTAGESDLLCPEGNDDRKPVDRREDIRSYQLLATTLIREIAHTGAAIRRGGSPGGGFASNELHAKIERFGWMATHAYFMRRCGYEIPFVSKGKPQNRFEAFEEYDAPVFGGIPPAGSFPIS